MSMSEPSQGLVATTLGAIEVGTFVATALFGLMTMQTYHYYSTYLNDKLSLKILVAWIWSLELAHTIIITRTCYVLSIDNFGNSEVLESVPFTIKLTILFDTVIAFTIQTYFAWRLRIMSNRWELAIFCWTLTLLRTITSLIAIARLIEIPQQSEFFKESKNLVTVIETVSAVNDVIVAAGLCYYLTRNRSGITKSDWLVGRLIRYTIQSGILTSVVSVAMLICFLAMPDNWIWIAVHMVLAKPFSNSLLAMLNARQNLRSQLINSDRVNGAGAIVVDRSADTSQRSTTQHSKRQIRPIEIEMTKMITSVTDEDFPKVAKVNSSFVV